MESSKESKRKKDSTNDDDERRKEKKSKRARSRSRSPDKSREKDSKRKRRHSRSQSPENGARSRRSQEKQNELPKEVKPEPPVRKNKETDMLNTRTGGAYIPPARLRMMQAQITDKSSIAYQRLAWEALKKSIHGHINKINVGNIGIIIKELLKENIVRGRGLLCRSVIQAQAASPSFTNVYAALVAAVNSRFPNIGELLLKRLVIQFKRGFKRNDKSICISAASFIAHLVNQRVAHEILALELLTLLVETPSDDSVEVAIAFLKECGQKLTEVSSKGVNAIFEMLRNILHEGQLDKRVQYMIEVMFQVWKDGFKDHPALLEELELVPEEEQFTHLLMLDDATDPQDILNVFKHDEKYEENETKYKTLSKEILGSDAESEDGSEESGSEGSDEEEDEAETEQKEMTIIDNTETNLVALRRTIYLTINSSLDFEECAHKLMKMQLKPGQEVELCHMFLDCCAEQRTYEKFYGLLAQRFCNLNRIYIGPFEEIFKDSYGTAHRLDTNRLRNVSKFFAHLLFTDSISWEVLECVKLNEEDTTSSSRIYIKILFQELAEYMGLKKLNDRLKDPTLQGAFLGVFPRDNPKNTRFSINFFTTIGLGGLTDELREHLKQMPKNVAPPPEIKLDSASSSDSSSSSSSSDSSDSSSDSDDDSSKKKEKKDKKKSKKDKKTHSPKTPQEEPDVPKDTERWGHDGFYDNYGKDARRHEQTHERDKDNFVIPNMPRRNDRKNMNDDRRRNDREKRSDDEDRSKRRDDDRNDRSRNREDIDRSKRRDDDRSRDREDIDRSKRRDDDRSRDREDIDRSKRRDDDRSRDREDIERSKRRDDDKNDRSRDREDQDGGRYRNDERRERDNERRDRRDKNGERGDSDKRDKDARRRDRDDDRRDKDSERRDREINTRDERQDNDDKRDREVDNRSRKENKDSRDDRSEQKRNKISKEGKDKDKRKEDEQDKDKRDSKREKTRKRDKNDRNKDDEIRERTDKDRNYKEKDSGRGKDKEQKKERHEERTRIDKDGVRWEINGEYKKTKSVVEKQKKVKKEKESDSDSSDSDDSSSSSSSSSSKDSSNDDGWDIRGNSIRKEVVERYWDIPAHRKRETVERSPGRERRRDR